MSRKVKVSTSRFRRSWVLDADRGRYGRIGKGRTRMALVGHGGSLRNPATDIARALSAALDPTTVPSKVKTLADMTPEERARITADLLARR